MLPERIRRRSRLFALWYFLIGCGFLLLGVNRLILRDAFWQVGLRWLISAGFFALSYLEFRFGGKRGRE